MKTEVVASGVNKQTNTSPDESIEENCGCSSFAVGVFFSFSSAGLSIFFDLAVETLYRRSKHQNNTTASSCRIIADDGGAIFGRRRFVKPSTVDKIHDVNESAVLRCGVLYVLTAVTSHQSATTAARDRNNPHNTSRGIYWKIGLTVRCCWLKVWTLYEHDGFDRIGKEVRSKSVVGDGC